MARRISGSGKKTTVSSSGPPLDAGTWEQVVRRLELAPQQARVVELLLLGKRDKQIAAAMGISIPTVRTYLTRVFQRLEVCDRIELIVRVFSVARSMQMERETHPHPGPLP